MKMVETVLKAKETITQPEPPKHVEENKVFDIVEQMPSFPGGPAQLMKWLAEHVQYPAVAQENGVQGRVIIAFRCRKRWFYYRCECCSFCRPFT